MDEFKNQYIIDLVLYSQIFSNMHTQTDVFNVILFNNYTTVLKYSFEKESRFDSDTLLFELNKNKSVFFLDYLLK